MYSTISIIGAAISKPRFSRDKCNKIHFSSVFLFKFKFKWSFFLHLKVHTYLGIPLKKFKQFQSLWYTFMEGIAIKC